MKNYLYIFLGVLAGLLVGGAIYLVSSPPRGESVVLIPPPTAVPLVVYVAGAVATPGVYDLPEGSRVQDAIDKAGGPLPDADETGLNLAAPLEDGQQIVVPARLPGLRIGTPPAGPTSVAPAVVGQLVNINTADKTALETLPGIGPTLAGKILDYRTQNGLFERIEDIDKVPGIGPATYDRIKDLITVGN